MNLLALPVERRQGLAPSWLEAIESNGDQKITQAIALLREFEWPTMGLIDGLCWNDAFADPEAFWNGVCGWSDETLLERLLNGDLTADEIRDARQGGKPFPVAAEQLSFFSQGTQKGLEVLWNEPRRYRDAFEILLRACQTPDFDRHVRQLKDLAEGSIQVLKGWVASEGPIETAKRLRHKPSGGPGGYSQFTFVLSQFLSHRQIESWGNGHYLLSLSLGQLDLWGGDNPSADLAEIWKVLADPTRLDILRRICCSSSYGKELASELGLTSATVSRHLDQLKQIGVIVEAKADSSNVKSVSFSPAGLENHWKRLRSYLGIL